MTKYYRKEIAELPVYILGQPIKFDILETADATLIAELDKCILRGVGGVISMTAEAYVEELKKKATGSSSPSGSTPKPNRQELSALHLPQHLAAVDGAQVNFGSVFANMQQGREHTPHNRVGLPGGATGPAGLGTNGKSMPDPIEVPSSADFKPAKPPTAKLSDVTAA